MSEAVLVALISGGLTFAGVLVTKSSGDKKVVDKIKLENAKNQAITEEKISELTREVREHNNFARRMPVVEEQIKVINYRIEDLEHGGK